MNCEIRYYLRTADGLSVYLGCVGKPVTMEEINSPRWQQNAVAQYDELLDFHKQFVPEEKSTVFMAINQQEDGLIVLSLWRGATEGPVASCTYVGVNPAGKCWKVSKTAHCWDLYLGADFSPPVTNAAMLLNELRKHQTAVDDGHLIRFMMYADNLYSVPYVYGYLRPLAEVSINKEALEKCPDDCYPLEIVNTYSGYYFAVKKSKFDSQEVITAADLTRLR